MIRPCAEENQRTSIQTKRRNSITDALLNPGRGRADRLAKFLESDALISVYACEVFVNRSRLWISFPCVRFL